MDIVQVRDVLRKTARQFEMDELDDLRDSILVVDEQETTKTEEESNNKDDLIGEEEVVEDGGEEEPTDQDLEQIESEPSVIEDEGDGGEDEGLEIEETVTMDYLSFLSETSAQIAEQANITEAEAWDAMSDVVDQIASAGDLDPMPDVDEATSGEMSEWVKAAKEMDLCSKTLEHLRAI